MLTQGITAAVKLSVRRGRPDGTEFSFPSGHSSVSFASATVLHRHFGWKVGAPAYAVATYVAASRIQEKRHFLSDVVFGAAVGIAAGRTVTIGRGDTRFALAPMASAGGAGVSFTWLGQQ
jgi:membrane-associated phospholipid phosphatase